MRPNKDNAARSESTSLVFFCSPNSQLIISSFAVGDILATYESTGSNMSVVLIKIKIKISTTFMLQHRPTISDAWVKCATDSRSGALFRAGASADVIIAGPLNLLEEILDDRHSQYKHYG